MEITSVVDKYYQSLGDKASFVEAYDNIKGIRSLESIEIHMWHCQI